MIVAQSLLKLGFIVGNVPVHAVNHGIGGHDPITSLGTLNVNAVRANMVGLPNTPTAIVLDCDRGNDFAIAEMVANISLSWINYNFGHSGSVLVKQDSVGGRTVTITPPASYTMLRYSAVPDLVAAVAPNAYTLYTWEFKALFPNALVIVNKFLPVAP